MRKLYFISILFSLLFSTANAQLFSITDSCSVLIVNNLTSKRLITYPKSEIWVDTTLGNLALKYVMNNNILASWTPSQISSLPAANIQDGYRKLNAMLSYNCVHITGQNGGGGGNVGSDTLRTLTGTYLPDFVLVEGVDSFSLYSANYIITDTLVTVSGFFSCRVLPNKRRGGFLLSLPTSGENIPYTKLHGNVTGYTVGFDNIPIDVGIVIIDTTFYPDSAAYFLFTGDTARKSLYAYTYTYVSNKRAIGQIVSYASANIYNSDGFVNASQRRVNIDMTNNVIAIIDTSTAFNLFGLPHGLAMGYLQEPLDYLSYGSKMYIASDSSQINITTGTFQKQSLNYAYTEPVDPIIDSSVMVVVGGSIGSWYKLNDIRGWSLNGNTGTDASNLCGTRDSSIYTAGVELGKEFYSHFIAKTSTYSGDVGNVNISMSDPINNYHSIISCDPSSHTVIDDINFSGDSAVSINLNNSTQILSFGFYSGFYNFPITSPAIGQIMVADGANNLSWQNITTNGTTGLEPSTPYLGQFYFDTTLVKMKFWNGTVWAVITSTP